MDFMKMNLEEKVRKVFEDYDNGLPKDQAIGKIIEIHLINIEERAQDL